MNTHPPTYYQHIERIAIALETIAASHKDNKLQQFKQAVNLVYAKKELADVNASDDHQSNIVESIEQNLDKQLEQSELHQQVYDQSQQLTGGEFSGWYSALAPHEKQAYHDVHNHLIPGLKWRMS
jgi:uncharacterized phage infection (PIP) family protein YhgE